MNGGVLLGLLGTAQAVSRANGPHVEMQGEKGDI